MAKGGKSGDKPQGDRTVSVNRRASFNYELGDKYEAGLALIGSEARSLRESAPDLTDAWVDIDMRGEAWVKGMRIPPMKHAAFGHEERRPRKLLLHREEIERMKEALDREGMTVVATKCYIKGGRAKLEVALARGKKNYDKRQSLKEKELDREAKIAMRRAR
jgi:SsrA-binding protein